MMQERVRYTYIDAERDKCVKWAVLVVIITFLRSGFFFCFVYLRAVCVCECDSCHCLYHFFSSKSSQTNISSANNHIGVCVWVCAINDAQAKNEPSQNCLYAYNPSSFSYTYFRTHFCTGNSVDLKIQNILLYHARQSHQKRKSQLWFVHRKLLAWRIASTTCK